MSPTYFCFSCPATAAAKSLQSCPTLCDPRDGSPPGSPVPGKNTGVGWHFLLQRMKFKVKVKSLSRVRLLVDPMDPFQAPPSMGFARQEYWSGVPLPSPPLSPATAAAKSLQSCPTLCDPIDRAHQAPLSLGFSRQEHWSGLPFPSSIKIY